MKKDEKNDLTRKNKTIRKINIEDIQKNRDIILDDGENFEFTPDYDSMDFFDEEIPVPKEGPKLEKMERRRSEIPGELEAESFVKGKVKGEKRIKKLQLTPEELKERKEVRKKRRSQNREILTITYVFAGLFALMIGYFAYFNGFVSKDVINSAYNVRINSFADSIVRGDILSSDGEILAETRIDSEGNESRYYPMGQMFAHAIGTSAINQSGVELSENFYMLQSNSNPLLNALQDIRGEKNQGDQVVTTLDAALQEAAYNALGYNNGAVIAIEPTTGKVLAMVSKPDYDPNTLVDDYESIVEDETKDVLLNKVTQGLFVPGSIFKTLTALAYVRSGAAYNRYDYVCEGHIDLGGEEYINCFDQNVHGEEDFMDSFAYSCNASFGNIGLKLKKDQLKDTCESLFFNKELPTKLPHSKSRFSLDLDASDWDIAATAIGQGKNQVTPLHMAMLTAAIANGGNMMEPYMVDRIETANGGRRVKKYLPESYGQVITTQEADLLAEMMEAVVSYGTAMPLSGYGYTVAGKTGTAEIDGKGDNSWFMGYAPAERPEIAICVLVENDLGYYESALPVANAVLQNYLLR